MRTLFKFLLPLLLLSEGLSAQQDPMYSMYMFDKMLINPAFTGSSNWAVATLKSRNQFMGLNGNPVTQTFNFHSPIQKKHIGVGFKLINDKTGIVNNLNAAALLSYHLNFAGGKLSVGFEGGIFNRKTNYQNLIVSSRDDNALPMAPVSSVAPDLSIGMYYQKKQFYAGLSNYHLIGVPFKDNPSSQSHLYKQMYLIAGNVFDLSKKFSLEPSVLLKYQPSSAVQLDINMMAYYNNRVGAGLQYRTGGALVTMFRINITEGFRIAYSYDANVSRLAPYSRGAHEIILSYGIKLPPPPIQKEIHPRYYF